MNLENLQQECLDWQRTLKLSDWDISVKLVPHREMTDAIGHVRWDADEKSADIRLITPEDYQSGVLRPYNIEETLVHELLHLHFVTFDMSDEPKRLAIEQAINAIARALVNLKNANLQHKE
ncbi:MAG: hypothetical protein V7K14_03785 [Nostoc sp.]|uniref:hypothetical protein n=1 Tax=Nostoc sp. TaxID=1180 RepID=UPI002FF6F62D